MDPVDHAYLQADLYLLSLEEGGRRKPIFSGFRCNCWIGALTENGERSYNDAAIYFERPALLTPGASTTVRIRPLRDESWAHVTTGSTIDLCEGPRRIGTAQVTEVFDHLVG